LGKKRQLFSKIAVKQEVTFLVLSGVKVENSKVAFEEACRMVGECCLMFAQNGQEISRERVALWLDRVQEEAVDAIGEPNDALQLAIERLNGR
jgi:hypothetical protein